MTSERIYGQFCPISMGAEIFATKWTPVVLRELMCGSTRFGQLKNGAPLMSRSLLSQRLQELEHAGLITITPLAKGRGAEYRLTEAGEALRPVVMALGDWAYKHLTTEIPDHNLDPSLLMWDMHRNIDVSAFPTDGRTVIQLLISGVPAAQRLWWLLIEHGDVEICLKRPAADNDLEVEGHIRDLTDVWLGFVSLSRALAGEKVRVSGDRGLRDAMPKWFLLNHFARDHQE
jgi:DNA-binding HxlR family transcriptional regulator